MHIDNIDINNFQEMRRLQQLEQMKKVVLGQIMTKEALERLSRIRIVNPQLAGQVDVYLLQIHQTGKLQGMKITDEKIKVILKTLTNDSPKFNIRRM